MSGSTDVKVGHDDYALDRVPISARYHWFSVACSGSASCHACLSSCSVHARLRHDLPDAIRRSRSAR